MQPLWYLQGKMSGEDNTMKKTLIILVVICVLLCSCTKNEEKENKYAKNGISSEIKENTEADNMSDKIVEYDKQFLMEELAINESMATSCANKLVNSGCGRIVKYEDKLDDGKAYSVTLINEEGKKFYTAFDEKGFIGPIKDEKGEYLYAPID